MNKDVSSLGASLCLRDFVAMLIEPQSHKVSKGH